MASNSRNEITKYLLINFIYEVARTIPHSFLTLYLISSGITIAQISVIQISYMISIILFEVPSGVLSDMRSKKVLFSMSCLFMTISYFCYIRITSFIIIAFAQFIYGIASALQTGTLDVLIINKITTDKINKIESIIRIESIVITLAMIIGSTIGIKLFYTNIYSNVYILSIVLFIIAGLISLTMEESIDDNSKKILKVGLVLKNCSIHLKEGIKSILFSKSLLFSFTIIAMIQFILQPFFNYWQPITISKGFAEGSLGMFYIGIQLVTIIAASIYKRLKRISFNINIGIILLSFSLIISLLSENKYIYIILFLLSIIPRHFILIRLNAKAQAQINNSHRSTITSINSMYSRLFSIFVLLIMGVLANYKISPAYTFIICCIIYMLISIVIYYFSKVQKRKKLNIS